MCMQRTKQPNTTVHNKFFNKKDDDNNKQTINVSVILIKVFFIRTLIRQTNKQLNKLNIRIEKAQTNEWKTFEMKRISRGNAATTTPFRITIVRRPKTITRSASESMEKWFAFYGINAWVILHYESMWCHFQTQCVTSHARSQFLEVCNDDRRECASLEGPAHCITNGLCCIIHWSSPFKSENMINIIVCRIAEHFLHSKRKKNLYVRNSFTMQDRLIWNCMQPMVL